ncbi:helix-turn-helix domain-containing protein [Croceibacterium sp. LX-88]|uniref:Helix-turn-helix domain-containing protein n=1 Tax=Croceibacterium selenioxidans TaxID=2838833 RepID=A0ABS5W429_9SPHN|nr:helix-turn-helix domain-containing protein [Croceibacterium selenioxidans]MBT2133965.1 helix-turn-helix domain-containing protein [Croceibacterium selenioxidans]
MNIPTPAPLAYSVADACRVTSIGRTRLYELIGQGKIATRKIGRRTLIPADALRAFVEGEAA